SSGAGLRLTDTAAGERHPTWSPDGRQLAFVSAQDGNRELYLLEVETGAWLRLTDTPGAELDPAWLHVANTVEL
ncbi:MAG: PD40 domain-containing protein, partial [Deinococcus sp.]|nr:PD40 domain-containing protein [Deinococcus sp.]